VKIRDGFVSNSSATAFIIVNKEDGNVPLTEFVREVGRKIIEEYMEEYGDPTSRWSDAPEGKKARRKVLNKAFKRMLKDAKGEKPLEPGDNYRAFGDEDGNTIGQVFDYGLREGGHTKRFSWRFEEWLR